MSIAKNLELVRNQIADAAAVAGRPANEITLVAVSKTKPVEDIAEAIAAEQTVFGENKVQELLAKIPQFPAEIDWHLIGHLQSNKTRKVLPVCAMIHSIDSARLAQQVDRIAGELGLTPSILLQVNVANDDAKFGFPVGVVREEIEGLMGLENVSIRGLMTVPAFEEDPENVRPFFARLRDLRDELEGVAGKELPVLSMGMSHDFAVAIEEGATHVRVGSSIFGARDYSR